MIENEEEHLHSNKLKKSQRAYSENRLIKLEKISFQIQAQKLRKQYSNQNLFNQMKLKDKHHAYSNCKRLNTLPNQITPHQHKNGHFLEPTKIISVTAQKWAIFDFYSSRYLRGYRSHDNHELTVFSKLLVFCTVNTLVAKHEIDMSRFETIASEGVLRQYRHETSLRTDDIIMLEDLLMMMITEESEVYEAILTVNIGAYLEKKRKKEYYSVFDANDKRIKEHLQLFYQLVNSYVKLLKLESITYLDHDPSTKKINNTCSASDIAVLSIQCLKIPLFKEILKKNFFTATIKYVNQQGNLQNKQLPFSNKAVLNQYITYSNVCRNWDQKSFMSAHSSIFYQDPKQINRPIVIVLLGCYSPSDRQKDIQQVVEWYIKNGGSPTQVETRNHNKNIIELEQISKIRLKSQIDQKQNAKDQDYLNKKLAEKLSMTKEQSYKNKYDMAVKSKKPASNIKSVPGINKKILK